MDQRAFNRVSKKKNILVVTLFIFVNLEVSTVERRFTRRRYRRKVGLREYFRATDHFYNALKKSL